MEMLATIIMVIVVGAIVLGLIGSMWIGFDYGKNSGKKDERDDTGRIQGTEAGSTASGDTKR